MGGGGGGGGRGGKRGGRGGEEGGLLEPIIMYITASHITYDPQ